MYLENKDKEEFDKISRCQPYLEPLFVVVNWICCSLNNWWIVNRWEYIDLTFLLIYMTILLIYDIAI